MPLPLHPHLTRPEWAAVAVALIEADKPGSATPPRPGSWRAYAGRIMQLLTGIERSAPLANPRLEAVRRFVLATRRRRQPAAELIPPLLDCGFSEAQVEALALLSR